MKLTGAIYALLSLAAFYGISTQAQRYVGGDISLLPDYEDAGAKYKEHDGKPIADLMPWLKEEGMNAMRVRLFVNPEKYRERHQTD
jgi:arabinogalactan endo-1,4-beta-galactosidase